MKINANTIKFWNSATLVSNSSYQWHWRRSCWKWRLKCRKMSVGTDITNRNMCIHCKGDFFRSLEVYPIFEEQGSNDMPLQQDGTPLDFHVTVRVRSCWSKFPWKRICRYGHSVPITLNHLISSSEVTYTFYKTLRHLHPPSIETCEMNLYRLCAAPYWTTASVACMTNVARKNLTVGLTKIV